MKPPRTRTARYVIATSILAIGGALFVLGFASLFRQGLWAGVAGLGAYLTYRGATSLRALTRTSPRFPST